MKVIGARVRVVALAVVAASACSGKLEVGDDATDASSVDGGVETGTGGTTPASTAGVIGSGGASSSSVGSAGTAGAPLVPDDSWVDEVTPTPAASGSSEECPEGPLARGSECPSDGLTCRYHYESTEHQECFCRRTSDDRQVWQCSEWHNREACPLEPPADLSGCYGSFGLVCVYPELECTCRSATEAWECPRPAVYEVPEPPEMPEPDRLVAELTDEERDTWCQWYSLIRHEGPGHALPEDRPVTGEYTDGVGCIFRAGFCEATVPKLSKSECVANLSLSECESPLANLTGCVIDMFSNDCGPFEYSCLDYLATPNCEGTVVLDTALPPGGPSCDVRVQ